MSNDTIFKIFVALAFSIIGVFTAIGGIKEIKESMKKLDEHMDAKEKGKEASGSSYHSHSEA